MKLKVTMDGRTVSVKLPPAGDVEIDLSGAAEEAVVAVDDDVPSRTPKTLADSGPSTKRVYRHLLMEMGDNSRVVLDPGTACDLLELTNLQLGKQLGKLHKMGLIRRDKRKRDGGGKVTGYEITVLVRDADSGGLDEGVDLAKSLWARTMEDIEKELDEETADMFRAICKLADVDGNVVAPPSEIAGKMESWPDVFPSAKIGMLEDQGHLSITDDEGVMVCLSVLGYAKLKEGGMPWKDWQSESPLPSPDL